MMNDATIRWVMLVSGVLTCTMVYAAIAPEAALESTFGQAPALDGPFSAVVVRNWGILIGLMGAMLIYGALNPAVRTFAITIAGTSKLAFIGLTLGYGPQYVRSAAVPLVIDSLVVVFFAVYLVRVRRQQANGTPAAV